MNPLGVCHCLFIVITADSGTVEFLFDAAVRSSLDLSVIVLIKVYINHTTTTTESLFTGCVTGWFTSAVVKHDVTFKL